MPTDMKERVGTLTPRHREILRLISLGCTNAEIGSILGLAVPTVDNHRSELMRRLGVDKAQLLARVAIKFRVSSMKDQLTNSEKRKSGRRNDGWN